MNNTIFKKYSNKLLIIGNKISAKSISIFLKTHYYTTDELQNSNTIDFSSMKYIYLSPGINLIKHEYLQNLIHQYNLKIVSDFDILYEYNPNGIYIGITGSAGKTTTVSMIKELFEQNNIKDYNFCGNQGIGVFDHNPNAKYHIMEISSFQLEYIENLRFDIGIITNIIPTHLNRHETFDVYKNLKLKLLKKCPEKKQLFYLKDVEESLNLVQKTRKNQSINEIFALSVIETLGFNQKNLSNFKKLPHRQELILHNDNLLIINDSKATTDIAVEFAIKEFQNNQPIYLIIGNRPKSLSLTDELIKCLNKVYELWIFGPNKHIWYEMFNKHISNIKMFNTINELPIIQKGTILFSPLGESFDQFKDYEERGNKFKDFIANNYKKI